MGLANEYRTHLAWRALVAFARLNGTEEEPQQTNLTDLLTDLLHCFGPEDFNASLDLARGHYAVEAEEETEEDAVARSYIE